MFHQSVSEILGEGGSAPSGCEMGPKSPALLGLNQELNALKLQNYDEYKLLKKSLEIFISWLISKNMLKYIYHVSYH